MDSRWTKGLSGEDKEKRVKEIKRHKVFLDEVVEMLSKELEEGTPDYESPSWAYHQADRNGANRKLKQIIKILTI